MTFNIVELLVFIEYGVKLAPESDLKYLKIIIKKF